MESFHYSATSSGAESRKSTRTVRKEIIDIIVLLSKRVYATKSTLYSPSKVISSSVKPTVGKEQENSLTS